MLIEKMHGKEFRLWSVNTIGLISLPTLIVSGGEWATLINGTLVMEPVVHVKVTQKSRHTHALNAEKRKPTPRRVSGNSVAYRIIKC